MLRQSVFLYPILLALGLFQGTAFARAEVLTVAVEDSAGIWSKPDGSGFANDAWKHAGP